MHTCGEDLYPSCIKIGEISILNFCLFLSFLLTWDLVNINMGEKIQTTSLKVHCPPKFMHTPRKSLCQSCINNFQNSTLDFWQLVVQCFSCKGGRLTVSPAKVKALSMVDVACSFCITVFVLSPISDCVCVLYGQLVFFGLFFSNLWIFCYLPNRSAVVLNDNV